MAIGGTRDHVHLWIGFKSSHRLDYFVRDRKADSTTWIHREIGERMFVWQKGYGAFAVSPSSLDGVTQYITKNGTIGARRFKRNMFDY